MSRYRVVLFALVSGIVLLLAGLLWTAPQTSQTLAAGTVNPILLYSWQKPQSPFPDSILPDRAGTDLPSFATQGDAVYFSGPFTQTLYVSHATHESTHELIPIQGVPGDLKLYSVLTRTLFLAAEASPQAGLYRVKLDQSSTERVRALQPEGDAAVLDNALLFSAWDSVNGLQLWRSDGSEAGTSLIKNLSSAGVLTGTTSIPHLTTGMLRAGPFVYFFVQNSYGISQNWTLWRSDGTPGGTVVLQSLSEPQVENGFSPSFQVASAGNKYFFVTRENFGFLLKVTAGTPGDTITLRNLPYTYGGRGFINLVTTTSQLVFFGEPDSFPNELVLWRSDGTVNGTFALNIQIDQGSNTSTPLPNDQLAIIGRIIGVPPFTSSYIRTDGTITGTARLDLPLFLGNTFVEGQTTWYAGRDQDFKGLLLYRTNNAGTEAITRFNVPGVQFTNGIFLGRTTTHAFFLTQGLFIQRFQEAKYTAHLWAIPLNELRDASPIATPPPTATPTTTSAATPQPTSTPNARPGQSVGGARIIAYGRIPFYPCGLIGAEKANDGLLVWFRAPAFGDPTCANVNQASLWRSDGTLTGTLPLSINADLAPIIEPSNPVTVQGHTLYVLNNDKSVLNGLYRITNSQAEILRPGLATGSVVLSGTLLFALREHPSQPTMLWRSNGTLTGTTAVTPLDLPGFDPRQDERVIATTAAHGKAFFVVVTDHPQDLPIYALWASNGTELGTTRLLTSTALYQLFPTNDGVFFFSNQPLTGLHLMFSDGTPQGTHELNAFKWLYQRMVADRHSAYFIIETDAGDGLLLGHSNGGLATTIPVMTTTLRGHLAVLNEQAFFFSRDQAGLKLWRSDGTLSNTVVITTFPSSIVDAQQIYRQGDTLYMFVRSESAIQLWQSDGTTAGTHKLRSWADSNEPLGGFDAGQMQLFSAGNTLLLQSNAAIYTLPLTTSSEWKVWISLTLK